MRISVVIPSFNHARFVGEAIRSVAAQDHEDVELIVVDDGSTDGSRDVIRAELAAVPGARLLEQKNAGTHAAIARGVAASTGACLTLLNSDDVYRPGRLRVAAERARGRRDYVLFTRVEFVDDASRPLEPQSAHPTWYRQTLVEAAEAPTVGFGLLRGNVAVTSGNLIFSRSVYDAVGGFCSLRMCHDWDFLMRATHRVEPELIDDVLLAYRVHGSNTSHSLRDVQEGEARTALNGFLRLCREQAPLNPLAPCPGNWPRFFDVFARGRSFHFGARPVADYVEAAQGSNGSIAAG